MRSRSPDAEAWISSRSRCVAMRQRPSSFPRRAQDFRLLLEVIVENGKHFAVPEHIDQRRPSHRAFLFHDNVRGNLDQRSGWIAQTAPGVVLQLDRRQWRGNSITNALLG